MYIKINFKGFTLHMSLCTTFQQSFEGYAILEIGKLNPGNTSIVELAIFTCVISDVVSYE